MVPFAAAVLVCSVFASKHSSIGPPNKHEILFTNANYPQFTLNRYQEVCQKPAHRAMPKK